MRIGLLCFLMLLFMGIVLLSPALEGVGEQDFLAYWSAARLLAYGDDPYDQVAMEAMVHAVRPEESAWRARSVWNPPWLLLVLAPLGVLPFHFAVRIWLMINFALVALSIFWLWQLFGEGPSQLPLAWLAGLLFGATLSALSTGQIVVLVLLAVTLFLRFLDAGHDRWAGAALFFAAVKPHLVYYVGFLAVIWLARQRRWGILTGGLTALFASLALSWLIVPNWSSSYSSLVGPMPFLVCSTATLDGVAQAVWGVRWFRLAGLALIPAAPLFLRLIDRSGWPVALSLALTASLPLAPFGFDFDQVLLLPAILLLLKWLVERKLPRRAALRGAAGLLVLYAVYLWQLTLPALPYHALAWVPLALGGLLLVIWRQSPLADMDAIELR